MTPCSLVGEYPRVWGGTCAPYSGQERGATCFPEKYAPIGLYADTTKKTRMWTSAGLKNGDHVSFWIVRNWLTNQPTNLNNSLEKLVALSREISRSIWNPNIRYRLYRSQLLLPVLIVTNRALLSCFFKIQFDSILTPTPRSSEVVLWFSFPHQNSVCISLFPPTCEVSCPSCLPSSNRPVVSCEDYKSWSFWSHVTFYFLGQIIFILLTILFPKTVSRCSYNTEGMRLSRFNLVPFIFLVCTATRYELDDRSRSQWPRGLRRELVAARLLGLRVRIPLGAWMFVLCVVEWRQRNKYGKSTKREQEKEFKTKSRWGENFRARSDRCQAFSSVCTVSTGSLSRGHGVNYPHVAPRLRKE
jgi:hypothetical protein